MSRAAILPFPGDPFLFNYWFSLYEKVWASEVDKLYVWMNSPIEPIVMTYVKNRIIENIPTGKVSFHYHDDFIDHGQLIKKALDHVNEEFVMLIEDDGFIFKTGHVNQCFNLLKTGYEIVGSKRGSCSQGILDGAAKKFGLSYEGLGDQGPNFWPCFFFARTSLLRKVDNFSSKHWPAGTPIEELDGFVSETDEAGDTMVQASLQLRNMVDESAIKYVRQYHAHPQDLEHADKNRFIFDGSAPWLHIGSLSSGINGTLVDETYTPLAHRKNLSIARTGDYNVPTFRSEFEKMEFERRAQWYSRFIDFYDNDSKRYEMINDFADAYRESVDRMIREMKLNRKRIEKRKRVFAQRFGL